jgi:integrase
MRGATVLDERTSDIAGRFAAMSVKIREYKRGGFEVDIRFTWPDGTPLRDRRRSPVSTRSASLRWGQAREAELYRAGKPAAVPPPEQKEVPTLEAFVPRFIDGYAKANRQKASTVCTKSSILRRHLVPAVGKKRLDAITNEDVAHLKAGMGKFNPKTVNNVINVLSKTLHVALEWGVIERMPCTIKLLKTVTPVMAFYEDEQYADLVAAARKIDPRIEVMVLLGGDAGLRRGEIVSLRQSDVDLRRRQLHVRFATWRGIEDSPKGGRGRIIPMTEALVSALTANRHLRGPRVLHLDDGKPVDENVLQDWIEQATRRAGLDAHRSLHILRHTFCSRLAMKGAPAKAIQELAGHQNLGTTLRYMHLSPAARESAIRLLDERAGSGAALAARGDILETGVLSVAEA